MFQISTKLEVNLLKNSQFQAGSHDISTFVIKNRIPAVVTEPEYVEIMVTDRARFGPKHAPSYKIICAIGFWDEKKYALEKIRDLPQNALMADGFEVLVTPGRSDKEFLNELRGLTEFFRTLGQKEIRWAMALRTKSPTEYYLEHMKKWPATFVRTDVNVASPSASIEVHAADIGFIKNQLATPIKISGDVDYGTIVALMGEAARFDVSFDQARRILKIAKGINAQREEIIYADASEEKK
jgi:hypothetical protein